MYHRQRKVRKILYIVFILYWGQFVRRESCWGCKCFSHCHRVECLLANQSCTCSCPPTQHSVRGYDNHWGFGVADPGQLAGRWCRPRIQEDERRGHSFDCWHRPWCIITCDPLVSACVFYQISLGHRVTRFHDHWGIGNSCYWYYVLSFALCRHLTNAIVHPLFARNRWS